LTCFRTRGGRGSSASGDRTASSSDISPTSSVAGTLESGGAC
jgi:hypothetical protein